MKNDTIYEAIALLNTANYDAETLNQKRDEVVRDLKEQLRIAVVVPSACGNYIPDKTTGMNCVNCGKSHFLH